MKKILVLLPFLALIIILTSSQQENSNGMISWPSYSSAEGDVVLQLPEDIIDYESIAVPAHYTVGMSPGTSPFGNTIVSTPDISNEGVTLGRVIFYDKNISINRAVSCGSCHKQANGFSDTKAFSEGFQGMAGHRNSISIADIGLNPYPALLWDERSSNLAEMSTLPLINGVELGILPEEILERFSELPYYPELFTAAFGDNTITIERIGQALAQFIRTIRPTDTKLDQGIQNNFAGFTAEEIEGKTIFEQHCQACHAGVVTRSGGYPATLSALQTLPGAFFLTNFIKPHNTGLDIVSEDPGFMNTTNNDADRGKFKIPHLKNVALSAPYMHDGRLATLEEVVEFYSSEIQPAENLAFAINAYYNTVFPQPFTGFNFTPTEKSALVAFLHTLTDENFNSDVRWSDPFVVQGSTGISDTEIEGLHISPNPVLTYADIRFAADDDVRKIVQLFDISGRKVWENQIYGQNLRFLRNGLPSGNYFLKIQNGEKSQTTRLMLQ